MEKQTHQTEKGLPPVLVLMQRSFAVNPGKFSRKSFSWLIGIMGTPLKKGVFQGCKVMINA